MTNSEVENHYADLRKEAIAFGEWLLKNGYFISVRGIWGRTSSNPIKQDYEYFTTEKLYNDFLIIIKKALKDEKSKSQKS